MTSQKTATCLAHTFIFCKDFPPLHQSWRDCGGVPFYNTSPPKKKWFFQNLGQIWVFIIIKVYSINLIQWIMPEISSFKVIVLPANAAVNGHLELTLLKGRQRFDAVSTSNLEVYIFRDWWIFTYFIFGYGESSPNNIWSMVNLERTCVLLFYYFLYFKVDLDLEQISLVNLHPTLFFAVVNLDPIIFEMRWINGESWPNDFDEKMNRGEDLRWVGSRSPLTRA